MSELESYEVETVVTFEATMSTWRFGKLLLDKYCLASEREASSMIPTLSPLSRKVSLSGMRTCHVQYRIFATCS